MILTEHSICTKYPSIVFRIVVYCVPFFVKNNLFAFDVCLEPFRIKDFPHFAHNLLFVFFLLFFIAL